MVYEGLGVLGTDFTVRHHTPQHVAQGVVRVRFYPSKYTTYHELAHYYFKSTIGPQWLTEGGAEFLNFYTLNLTEGGTIDADYIHGQGVIAAACAPDGSANVHGWNETGAGSNLCPYWLGHQFLGGMYRALGHEVVSSALRELYETTSLQGTPIRSFAFRPLGVGGRTDMALALNSSRHKDHKMAER